MLTPTQETLLIVMIFVIMFGLGCALSLSDLKKAFANPKPIVVGFASQYLLMPALAFGLAAALDLSDAVSIGLIIVACCPSGATSSLFNYFAKGDLALSMTLSTITTATALLIMPPLLALYSQPFVADGAIQIDQGKVIGSLAICLAPVAAGIFLRTRSERWAKNMEETGGALGIIAIVFLIATWLPGNFDKMVDSEQTSPAIFVAAVFLGLGGFLFGYYFSRALGMDPRSSRTVSLETGIQNGPLAFAIIILSFGDSHGPILWPALLYSFFIVNTSTLITYLIRKYTRREWFRYENEVVKAERFTQGWLKP